MYRFVLYLLLVFPLYSSSQIVSGPMLGQVELRAAKIWVEIAPGTKGLKLVYSPLDSANTKSIAYSGPVNRPFNPVQFVLGGLEPGTTYSYQLYIDGKPTAAKGLVTTKQLWQYRKPAPDFSFIAGSCSYFNEPAYDRPGKPYGRDSSIFTTMSGEKAAFMLWLGDNWYTREVDYSSEWGLWYRAHRDRKMPVLQPLLKAFPHYAIWDDHDFGPNDIGGHYVLKETSRTVFNSYWANPSSGEKGEGIYTKFSYGDADFFLCDDRWWRSADEMKDSIDGRPDPMKKMLGEQQLNWLKNSLLYSRAVFKFIVIGSQALNPASPWDKLADFPTEYQELMDFFKDNRIDGVLFLTGDRHHSEVIKLERQGTYPLYDITVSPLTSTGHPFGGPEINNPYRVFGLAGPQNYARFSFSGAKGKRRLTVEFKGVKGESLGSWSIAETELKTPR